MRLAHVDQRAARQVARLDLRVRWHRPASAVTRCAAGSLGDLLDHRPLTSPAPDAARRPGPDLAVRYVQDRPHQPLPIRRREALPRRQTRQRLLHAGRAQPGALLDLLPARPPLWHHGPAPLAPASPLGGDGPGRRGHAARSPSVARGLPAGDGRSSGAFPGTLSPSCDAASGVHQVAGTY